MTLKKVLSTEKFYSFLLTAISLHFNELINPALKPVDVPQEEVKEFYDFVIVGGGIAGCVLARRLTEVPDWTVLLMEAGGDETPESSPPFLFVDLKKTELDWNFTTVPQKRACLGNNGVCEIPRGRGLGGDSIIFSMVHGRGSPKDFNLAAKMFNIPQWRAEKVLKYFIKLENATGLNRPDFVDRGYKGPLQVAYPRYKPWMEKEFIRAGEEIGWIERDYNGPIVDNTIACPQLNVFGPIRHSAAKAYLYPIKNRKNLAIIKYSFAIRIIINKKRRAFGVEYVRGGRKYIVKAKKEVLISAGVFNSPKLLMLSGIGPKEELEKHGINIIEDLPTGRNLQDQVGVAMHFELDKNVTMTPDVWKTKEAILKFVNHKDGPLTTNGIAAVAFNGKESSEIPPSIFFSFYNRLETQIMPKEDIASRNIITILVSLTQGKSRGRVTLRSSDPFDPPVIDPRYLTHPGDYDILRSGLWDVLKFMETSVMKKYSPKIYIDLQPKCKSTCPKKLIECLMINYATSQYRAVGTTRLGVEESATTVVNPQLKVKNIQSLRVVGSSVPPSQLTGVPFGTTYMIAERVSNMIKSEYHPSGTKVTTSQHYFGEAAVVFQQMVHHMVHNDSSSET